MAISIETLALARQYAQAVAAANSKKVLNQAIEEAVAQSKVYIDSALSGVTSFKVQIVESLPSSSSDIDTHTIYFLRRETPSGEQDYYYEYLYINSKWELIGSTELDLTDYWTSEEVKEYIDNKQYSLPVASTDTLGGVKVDMTTITINEDGVISVVKSATEEIAGNTAQQIIDKNFTVIKDSEINNLF